MHRFLDFNVGVLAQLAFLFANAEPHIFVFFVQWVKNIDFALDVVEEHVKVDRYKVVWVLGALSKVVAHWLALNRRAEGQKEFRDHTHSAFLAFDFAVNDQRKYFIADRIEQVPKLTDLELMQ